MANDPIQLEPIKSGPKTTEFWITIFFNICAMVLMLQGVLEPKVGTAVMGIVSSVYATLRTMVKR